MDLHIPSLDPDLSLDLSVSLFPSALVSVLDIDPSVCLELAFKAFPYLSHYMKLYSFLKTQWFLYHSELKGTFTGSFPRPPGLNQSPAWSLFDVTFIVVEISCLITIDPAGTVSSINVREDVCCEPAYPQRLKQHLKLKKSPIKSICKVTQWISWVTFGLLAS